METFKKLGMWAAWLAAAIFTGALLVAAGRHYALNKGEWASWVQAIGACAGIAIAIYVPAQQRKNAMATDEQRRIDEARRVCLAFRDELGTLRANIDGTNIRQLLAVPDGGIFDRRIPVPADRFPIYKAYVGRITEIDNPAVRHGVIAAYEMVHALMEAGALNNQLLLDYRDAYRRADESATEFNIESVERQESALRSMCAQMKKIAELGINKIEIIIPLLDAEVRS